MSDISIVIPGMNTRDYVSGCLKALAKTDWRGYQCEIIYVDNGSRDDSIDLVRTQFPYVKVIANATNVGFCKGANQGAAAAAGRYVLHLNNDTLLEPDAVPLLAEFLDRNPHAAVVGSRLLNPDGTEQWSARRFPAWYNAVLGRRSLLSKLVPNSTIVRKYLFKDELEGDVPFRVDWVPTPCMMVRADLFREMGGFPEDYYYWHEAIFCHNLRDRGGEVFVHPKSRVTHFEGKGGGPRPYRVRRWHIVDFHKGAYRYYCECYRLSRLNPVRWFAATALALRAMLLLTANRLASFRES